MEAEVWKDIPGYEGAYQVSSLGRVRSLPRVIIRSDGRRRTIKEALLTPRPQASGHLDVVLWRNGGKNHHRVHSLVALAFIGARPEGMEVCHADGDPTNNAVDNLRYDTRRANQLDIYDQGGKMHKLSVEDVRCIRKRLAAGEIGRSIAKDYGVTPSVVYRINSGKEFGWLQ